MSDFIKVPAVERVLDILEYLSSQTSPQSLKAIGETLQIPSASLFRILKNLTARNYVIQVKDNPLEYEIGYKIPQIAKRCTERYMISDIAKPYMEKLSHETAQTAQLMIMKGKKFMYIEQVLPSIPVRFVARLYTPMEINTSAGAKCILAQMDRTEQEDILKDIQLERKTENTIVTKEAMLQELELIRKQGWGMDKEEFNLGIGCVAAPIINAGRCIGAIGVTGKIDDYKNVQHFVKIKELVLQTALHIADKMQ